MLSAATLDFAAGGVYFIEGACNRLTPEEPLMKSVPLVLATMFAAAAFVPVATVAKPSASQQIAAMPAASDLSAARKKRRVRIYPYYYEPAYVRPRWGGADPAFTNQGEIQFRRSIGQCVIDLGYGRWESCSVGGPH